MDLVVVEFRGWRTIGRVREVALDHLHVEVDFTGFSLEDDFSRTTGRSRVLAASCGGMALSALDRERFRPEKRRQLRFPFR